MAQPSLDGLQRALRGCVDPDLPFSPSTIVSFHSLMGYAECFTRDLDDADLESADSLLEEISERLDGHLSRHPVHDAAKKVSFNVDVGSCTDFVEAAMGRLPSLQELEEAEKVCDFNGSRNGPPSQVAPQRLAPPQTQASHPQPSQQHRPSPFQPRNQFHQPPTQPQVQPPQRPREPDVPDLGRAVSRSVFGKKNENRRSAGGQYTPRSHPRPSEPEPEFEEDEIEASDFSTAKQLLARNKKEGNSWRNNSNNTQEPAAPPRRSLGGKRRGFNPPYKKPAEDNPPNKRPRLSSDSANDKPPEKERNPILDDDRVQGMDEAIVKKIILEILEKSPSIAWDDIAGLEFAKSTVKEIVIAPMLRPDIFTGLRAPPRGLLLFGPPGTGKTLIGRVIASQSRSTFFSISASSLTSKWIGEGEKLVRALFAVARILQPSVIFVDEIDSLLSSRSEGEQEASRRLKTEFLVQMDGAATDGNDRLLLIGATNRPQELDEAMRRRLVKRLYIPLPDSSARGQLTRHLLKGQSHSLTDDQLDEVVVDTDGYSGFDINALCKEAALGPLRMVGDIETVDLAALPPISASHFKDATRQVRPSVSDKDLDTYLEWNRTFGSFPNPK